MITKNEEKVLARCLKSAVPLVDEIVLVDTGSKDQTLRIAQDFEVRIFEHPWKNDFSEARNYAIAQCQSSWCFSMDADEEVQGNVQENRILLEKMMKNENTIGRVSIINSFFDNREQIQQTREPISRIFPSYCRFEGAIHEQLPLTMPRKDTGIELFHDGYLNQDKSERNIPILRQIVKKESQNAYYLYQLGREYRNKKKFGQAETFFSRAYANVKRSDGIYRNLIVDYLYNIISYKNYEKGLELIEKEQDYLRDYPDFWFATGLFCSHYANIDFKFFSMIEHCFQNCLRIGETKKYTSVLGTGSFLPLFNLGTLYESMGDFSRAKLCYEQSEQLGYAPAKDRLAFLQAQQNEGSVK